jgi:hypothetical protein
MRTTIDLPDELYRTLKTRAAISGVTMRELVQRLIEEGLSAPVGPGTRPPEDDPLPVAIPDRGEPIRALTNAELHDLDVDDYLERRDRSA